MYTKRFRSLGVMLMAAASFAAVTLSTPIAAQTNPTIPTTPSTGGSNVMLPVIVGATPSAPAPVVIPPAPITATKFGNFLRPFAATSPWNSRPVNPKLGTDVIPTDSYDPVIMPGKYSTGAFEAKSTDGPMTVVGTPGQKGLWEPDGEQYIPSITIPRWPASTTPATGGDGHCDIVDPITGIVHSFWQLKKVDGKWTAWMYAWTKIGGRGWGDPAHYYQGARAAAVPPLGGLIRKHEIIDTKSLYEHALAMSMTYSGLSPNPTYVYPATSADSYAAWRNKGKFPEGALVMLPKDFDVSALKSHELRKVANTLKAYGAYVVDQNDGVPFYIYVENGSGYEVMQGDYWENLKTNEELQSIRRAMRMVIGADGWLDGNGNLMPSVEEQQKDLNLLSMRGVWPQFAGTLRPVYDTWKQALVFPATKVVTEVHDANGRGFAKADWVKIVKGDKIRVTAVTTGGGNLRVRVMSGDAQVNDTDYLANGESKTFTWPAGGWLVLHARSGTTGVESTVSGTMYKQ